MTFANRDGRVILSLLDIKYLIVTSTLTAGRTSYKLPILETPSGCINTNANTEDLVSGRLLQRFTGNSQRTGCEVCYAVITEMKGRHVNRRCCNMTENDYAKYLCYQDEYGKAIFKLFFLPNIPIYITLIAFLSIFTLCLPVMVSSLSHQRDDRSYYYLTENTMSIICIARYIIIENHGQAVSKIRRIVFVVFLLNLYFSRFRQYGEGSQIYLDCLIIYWAFFIPFTKLLNDVTPSKDDQNQILRQGKPFLYFSKIMAQYLQYDIRDIAFGETSELDDFLFLISLPFNMKRWKAAIEKFYHMVLQEAYIFRREHRNTVCTLLPKCTFRVLASLLCIFNILVVFVVINILLISTIFDYIYKSFKLLVQSRSKKQSEMTVCYYKLRVYCLYIRETLNLVLTVIFLGLILLFSWFPFIVGLITNLLYFIPHITVAAVSSFYFWQLWKTIDDKYFALKLFIYEEYREMSKETDDVDIRNENKENKHCTGGFKRTLSQNSRTTLTIPYKPYHYWVKNACHLYFFISIYIHYNIAARKPCDSFCQSFNNHECKCSTIHLQFSNFKNKRRRKTGMR